MNKNRRRRNGVVIVYVALGLTVFLGAAGLAVDSGFLYHNRTKAQRAADAAALAGAIKLAYSGTKSTADEAARMVATANGYNIADTDKVTFTSVHPVNGNWSWYQVTLTREEPVFFMAALGFTSRHVGASATALFQQPVNLNISGEGQYGVHGKSNLSVFGPWARHSYGDMYSTRYYNNGTVNEKYLSEGYDFHLKVDPTYYNHNRTNIVDVEIFDPDSYNKNNNTEANGDDRVDEYRDSPFSGYEKLTTTKYKLYYTKGTPETTDDILISEATYDGQYTPNDMKWVKPSGFQLNLTDSRWNGNKAFAENAFRINVQSIEGSSENGFNLRAGPPRTGSQAFDSLNRTGITGSGRLPINFNKDATVRVDLGFVPATSTQITIDKFDTDVGAKSVTYTDGVNTFTGILTKDDEFRPDTFDLPPNYPGGTWRAIYTAGVQDTSSWAMRYTGPSLNRPGLVRLVK